MPQSTQRGSARQRLDETQNTRPRWRKSTRPTVLRREPRAERMEWNARDRMYTAAVKCLAAVMVALGLSTLLAQAPAAPSGQEQASRPSFAEWLDGVRTEAASRGIRPEIVQEALANVEEPMPVVLERDRTQAETVLSIESYLARQITARRVRTGREMVARYATTLDKVSQAYGV